MPKEQNRSTDIELRKRRDIMRVSGTGIMVFAVWSVIKVLGLFYLNKSEIYSYFAGRAGTQLTASEERTAVYIVYGLIALLMLIIVLIELYVGKCAVSEGKGRRCKGIYLFFAVIMFITTALSAVQPVLARLGVTAETASDDVTARFQTSAIVELTLAVLLAEMIYSAIRVRKLTSPDGYAGKHFRG